jgi:hypothetical protein
MYENEIKQLEYIKKIDDFQARGFPKAEQALDAAIALMRAAEPRDEAAEREHCERAAHEGWNGPLTLMVVIERERAAARAPLQTEIEQLRIELLKQEGRAEGARDHRIELQAQLATAQAEIAELREEQPTVCCGEYGTGSGHHSDECEFTTLENKLATAQAEIERLKAEDIMLNETVDKLATLRAAAERAVVELQDKHLSLAAFDALRAALDATPTTVDPRVTRLIEAARVFEKRYGENDDVWALRAALEAFK